MQRLIVLELNEVNFDYLDRYGAQGRLPNLTAFFARHGYVETTSEQAYEELEPWIQWVTAHTGKSFADHGIMRLGDITHHDLDQIWEQLERDRGLKVAAMSPMNASNRLKDPAFFIPDPWTRTGISGSPLAARLYDAIAQTVNDNAHSKVTGKSLMALLAGWLRYAQPGNWERYVRYAAGAKGKPWFKALFLDLLLADVFLSEWKRSKPDFSTLFLNAAAHIQHHYMFSSGVYDGPNRNPEWYIRPGLDPLLDAYELYDHILGQAEALNSRIMMATGLHQDPYPTLTYYYRLKNHEAFLKRVGVPFRSVAPRMSRDFHIYCADATEAADAERRLLSVKGPDGVALFYVDNRGSDLFVMLTYPNEIGKDFTITVGNEQQPGFMEDVAFVALKNGGHNGVGYFADSGSPKGSLPQSFPLKDMPARIHQAFS